METARRVLNPRSASKSRALNSSAVLHVLVGGLLIAAVGLPALAAAKPKPPRRVALILEPARAADADKVGQLTSLIEAELQRRGIERARLLAGFDPMGLQRGRELLRQARDEHRKDHDLRRAEAIEGLYNQALLNLKSSLGSVTIPELISAHLGLAATRLAQADRRLAEEYLLTALYLRPDLPEQALFGARELTELMREVKATLSSRETGTIALTSTPRGAEVYLGDTLVGYTPLTLDKLGAGTHLLRIRKEGFYEHGFLATVLPGSTVRLTHRLKPMGGRAQLEKWGKALRSKRTWKKPERLAEAAQGIRRLVRAPEAIVARVKRSKKGYHLTGAIIRATGAPERLDLVIPVDASLLDTVRSFLARAIPAAVQTAPTPKAPPGKKETDESTAPQTQPQTPPQSPSQQD